MNKKQILKKHGLTEAEFYKLYPTKESYIKAMGGDVNPSVPDFFNPPIAVMQGGGAQDILSNFTSSPNFTPEMKLSVLNKIGQKFQPLSEIDFSKEALAYKMGGPCYECGGPHMQDGGGVKGWAKYWTEELRKRTGQGIPVDAKKYVGAFERPELSEMDSIKVYPQDPRIGIAFKGPKTMVVPIEKSAIQDVNRINKPVTTKTPSGDVWFDYYKPFGGEMTPELEGTYPVFNFGGVDPSIPAISSFDQFKKMMDGGAHVTKPRSQEGELDKINRTFMEALQSNYTDHLYKPFYENTRLAMKMGGNLPQAGVGIETEEDKKRSQRDAWIDEQMKLNVDRSAQQHATRGTGSYSGTPWQNYLYQFAPYGRGWENLLPFNTERVMRKKHWKQLDELGPNSVIKDIDVKMGLMGRLTGVPRKVSYKFQTPYEDHMQIQDPSSLDKKSWWQRNFGKTSTSQGPYPETERAYELSPSTVSELEKQYQYPTRPSKEDVMNPFGEDAIRQLEQYNQRTPFNFESESGSKALVPGAGGFTPSNMRSSSRQQYLLNLLNQRQPDALSAPVFEVYPSKQSIGSQKYPSEWTKGGELIKAESGIIQNATPAYGANLIGPATKENQWMADALNEDVYLPMKKDTELQLKQSVAQNYEDQIKLRDPLTNKAYKENAFDVINKIPGEDLANWSITGMDWLTGQLNNAQERRSRKDMAYKKTGDYLGPYTDVLNLGDHNQKGILRPHAYNPNVRSDYNYLGQSFMSEFGGQYAEGGQKGPNFWNASQVSWPMSFDNFSSPDVKARQTLTAVPREEANLEAEGGETVFMNEGGVPAHFKIQGKRHSQGGVPLYLQDAFIFSDTRAMKIKDPEILKQFGMAPRKSGYTPAEIAKKYNINKYRQILADKDSTKLQKDTAELMISNFNLKLGKLSLLQESKKGFPQGLPKAAMGYIETMQINPNDIVLPQGQQMPANPDMAEFGGQLPTAQFGKSIDDVLEMQNRLLRAGVDPHNPQYAELYSKINKEYLRRFNKGERPSAQADSKEPSGWYGADAKRRDVPGQGSTGYWNRASQNWSSGPDLGDIDYDILNRIASGQIPMPGHKLEVPAKSAKEARTVLSKFSTDYATSHPLDYLSNVLTVPQKGVNTLLTGNVETPGMTYLRTHPGKIGTAMGIDFISDPLTYFGVTGPAKAGFRTVAKAEPYVTKAATYLGEKIPLAYEKVVDFARKYGPKAWDLLKEFGKSELAQNIGISALSKVAQIGQYDQLGENQLTPTVKEAIPPKQSKKNTGATVDIMQAKPAEVKQDTTKTKPQDFDWDVD